MRIVRLFCLASVLRNPCSWVASHHTNPQKALSWKTLLAHSVLTWRGGETAQSNEQGETEEATLRYPDWFIPLDQDSLQPFLEIAQHRHDQAVRKARDSYFHYDPTTSVAAQIQDNQVDDEILAKLALEEFEIISFPQGLPDFHQELKSSIFVTKTPLFTQDECRAVIDLAEDHFAVNNDGTWNRMASGQYLVAGFWIRHVPQVHDWFRRMVQRRLFPLLAQQFPHFVSSPHDLVVDNAYLFKYTPETGRRTDVHTDSGCLSFTIALNQRQDDYQGGGTWFEGLDTQSASPDGTNKNKQDDDGRRSIFNSILEMDQGQVTIRPGGVRHCGHAVTAGVRYIIGGFCMNIHKVEPVRQLVGLASELLQQQGHDQQQLQKVEQILQAALTINPYFDGVYTHLATVYQKLDQIARARRVLEYCHAHVNPKSGEAAYSLGLLCLEQGDYDQVQSCMRVCLEADANDVGAMALMAQAISHKRQRRAPGISTPNSLEKQQQQEEEQEETWYHRIVQNPDATSQQLASAYCNLGVLHEGREDEASWYQKSLEYDNTSFATWYSLACALASQKQYETAAHAFRQAVSRAGDENNNDAAAAATANNNRSKALHALYRLAVAQLREQPPNRFSSQQEMLQELKRIMGEENYNLLAAESK